MIFHRGTWHYEVDGKCYIKVGAYGTDDLEYIIQKDGSVYLPEVDRYYTSLGVAYTKENERWIKNNM